MSGMSTVRPDTTPPKVMSCMLRCLDRTRAQLAVRRVAIVVSGERVDISTVFLINVVLVVDEGGGRVVSLEPWSMSRQ